jgi:HipA-like protein
MPTPHSLARHAATRYVQPLREGGSLPAVVDTADGGLFVVKFRGAGQGPKALIAELVVGQLAQALDLPVPELALVDLSAAFGRSEPDPEIQDILRGSQGVNVGLRYLDGAFNFDAAAAGELISPEFATRLVWLDALVTNPDRSHRNPNLLVWRRGPWLIDHGGALYAHHDWPTVDEARTRTPFPRIRDHVLLDRAGDLGAVDATLAGALSPDVVAGVLARVPDALLTDPVGGREFASAAAARARYVEYLTVRLRAPRDFVAEATRAQAQARREPPRPLSARR